MNKRQAKKQKKNFEYRKEYDFLPIKTIKKYDRQYEAFFNSPTGEKIRERENRIWEFKGEEIWN